MQLVRLQSCALLPGKSLLLPLRFELTFCRPLGLLSPLAPLAGLVARGEPPSRPLARLPPLVSLVPLARLVGLELFPLRLRLRLLGTPALPLGRVEDLLR
jgi:hypothetical protein